MHPTMNTNLFGQTLKTKRDLLHARRVARQAAGLLGFDAGEQIALATATFDLACQAHAATGRARIDVDIDSDWLRITCACLVTPRQRKDVKVPEPLVISKRLPATGPMSREDVGWMLQTLQELRKLDVFEEVRRINQDLLGTLLELARLREAGATKPEPMDTQIKLPA
jgi:hypothetical protein